MTDSIPCSFHTLHRHSIFQPSAPSPEHSDSPQPSTHDDLVPSKKQRLVMRAKEIIVAIGREIRLANLSGDGFEVRNDVIGKYSTLVSPALTFEILSLVLNPTGRLLAVIGRSQIVVLVLPRPGSATRGQVACRSIVIDAPQYSASSATAIAKVLWHPLGQNGESLWVLSADGQLHEYDIQSPHDPIQTFAFLPPPPASASSRFSAIDPLSRIATSFTFGPPTRAGWGELTIHGLVANGDLYTLCPVIPSRTEVPIKYIQRLKAYVGEKGTEEERYWLDSLTRQVKLNGPGSPQASPVKLSVLGRSAMNRQPEKEAPINGDQMVRLHPPHLTPAGGPAPGVHMELERQGPAVFDPAAMEGEEEDVAGDLTVVSETPEGKGKGKAGGEVRVLGICWSGGRVDVGVEVDRVQGRWAGMNGSRAKSPAVATIPILESIQLDVPSHLSAENAPAIITDPLHSDTFYIQHIAGVDAISVLDMVSSLSSGKGDISACQVAQLVSTTSKKPQPIEGLVTCYNFSLGYGLLALSPINRLATIELDFRGSDQTAPSTPPIAPTPDSQSHPDTSSLILSNPLGLDHLLSTLRPSPSLVSARSALGKLSTANKPLSTIGAPHLRAIGDLISALQSRIEALRTASQAVERHLDLQSREFARQIRVLEGAAEGVEGVKKHDAVKRAEGMMVQQGRLAGRMDRVLAGLTGMYRPPVGEVERGWFEELEGVRKRVRGGEGWGLNRGKGLQGQMEEMENELEEVKPSVEAVNKEFAAKSQPSKKAGAKQIRPLESALYSKMDEIGRLMRKMDGLKVEVEEALEGGLKGGSQKG